MAAFNHFLDSLRTLNLRRNKDAPAKRTRVGIAFSSGGAKGLAHIGVIQVLEENGIDVDVVAGTSMGAYVGGLWASGLDGRELASLAAEVDSRGKLWTLVDPLVPPRRGFIGGKRILSRLRRSLGKKTFAELEKPFYCVATELNGFGRAVLHHGDVASAIVASLAVPGVVRPVLRNGVEYIDGGVSDPLPVNLLREVAGADVVIGVNVIPKVSQTRRYSAPPRRYRFFRNPVRWADQHLNPFARGNLLDILRGAVMSSQIRLVRRSAQRADLLIEAIKPDPRWHDYDNHEAYIKLGREAAERALPQLRALLEEPEAEEEQEVFAHSLRAADCIFTGRDRCSRREPSRKERKEKTCA